MRTLPLTAVALAALALTGCYDSSYQSYGTANVYWAFRRAAPAQLPQGYLIYDASYVAAGANGVCPESAVETVRVASAAGTFDIDCTGPAGGGAWVQGAVVDFLPAGFSNLTLTAFRGSSVVYRSTVGVNVPANGFTDVYVDLIGISAPLDAYGYLAWGLQGNDYLTCTEAGSPNVSVEIYDAFGTLIDDSFAGCSNPLPAYAYAGDLDLDDYTLRMKGFELGTNALVFDACDQPLAHFGPQIGAGGFTTTLFTLPVPACL